MCVGYFHVDLRGEASRAYTAKLASLRKGELRARLPIVPLSKIRTKGPNDRRVAITRIMAAILP